MDINHLRKSLEEIIESVPGQACVVIKNADWSFEHKAQEKLPAASIIKLLILLEAFRAHRTGEVDLYADIKISPESKVGGTGVLSRLQSVTVLSLRDLIALMIIVSDNTATNHVIEAVGLDRVNALVKELGLTGTVLQRKMMDFEARARGLDNFTTANDTARILEIILDGSLTGPELRDNMMEILRNQQFNHKLPARFARSTPGDPVLAHKTGELPGTEHDAGILETDKGPIIMVILTNNIDNNVAGQDAIARMGALVHQWATT